MKYPKLIITFILCFLLLSLGCSSKKEAEETSPGGVEGAFSVNSVWTSGCFDSDRFGLTMTSRFEIEGEAFRRINEYHSDGTCSELSVTSTEEGALARQAAVSGEPSGTVDFIYQSVEITAVGEPGILALNAVVYCGSSDWKIGISRNVTRSSGGSVCWDRTPRSVHDIYYVDGHALFFGVGTDKEKLTSAGRPTTPDFTRRWAIQ